MRLLILRKVFHIRTGRQTETPSLLRLSSSTKKLWLWRSNLYYFFLCFWYCSVLRRISWSYTKSLVDFVKLKGQSSVVARRIKSAQEVVVVTKKPPISTTRTCGGFRNNFFLGYIISRSLY